MSNQMVFCRGCGQQIHESAGHCPQCGAPQRPVKTAARAPKSKVTAGILALILGGFGVHKFYTGAWGWGLIYLLFCWTYLPGIAALVEGIRYLTLSDSDFSNKLKEANGPFALIW